MGIDHDFEKKFSHLKESLKFGKDSKATLSKTTLAPILSSDIQLYSDVVEELE